MFTQGGGWGITMPKEHTYGNSRWSLSLFTKLKKDVLMNTKTNDQIERFIQDALLVDEEQGKTLVSLRKIILKISSDA